MPDAVFYFIPSTSACDKDQWNRDTLESSYIDTLGHVTIYDCQNAFLVYPARSPGISIIHKNRNVQTHL